MLEVRQALPFEHEDALNEALERQAEIDGSLGIEAQDQTLIAVEED